MLKSMTGFGAADVSDENFRLHLEIRAVNQRFLDLSFHMPRSLYVYEEKITNRIKSKISRGKVEVSINVQDLRESAYKLNVDMSLARAYKNALDEISEKLNLHKIGNSQVIASYPGVLIPEENSLDGLEPVLYEALDTSVKSLDDMRLREGKRIEEDFIDRLSGLKEMVNLLKSLNDESVLIYRERLKKTIQEMLVEIPIDEGRLIEEVAIYGDRVNYTEEVVRLNSHFDEYRNIMNETNPVGRKLDFLIQEMNRETNTIGSKCNNKDAQKLVVDMKAEIEKLREQVQNIE